MRRTLMIIHSSIMSLRSTRRCLAAHSSRLPLHVDPTRVVTLFRNPPNVWRSFVRTVHNAWHVVVVWCMYAIELMRSGMIWVSDLIRVVWDHGRGAIDRVDMQLTRAPILPTPSPPPPPSPPPSAAHSAAVSSPASPVSLASIRPLGLYARRWKRRCAAAACR